MIFYILMYKFKNDCKAFYSLRIINNLLLINFIILVLINFINNFYFENVNISRFNNFPKYTKTRRNQLSYMRTLC